MCVRHAYIILFLCCFRFISCWELGGVFLGDNLHRWSWISTQSQDLLLQNNTPAGHRNRAGPECLLVLHSLSVMSHHSDIQLIYKWSESSVQPHEKRLCSCPSGFHWCSVRWGVWTLEERLRDMCMFRLCQQPAVSMDTILWRSFLYRERTIFM